MLRVGRGTDGRTNSWIPFTRRERFYDDLTQPATINLTYVFMYSTLYFYPLLAKFGSLDRFFMEVCNIKFHGNPSNGSYADNAEGLTFGQTFYDYANASKTVRLRLPAI